MERIEKFLSGKMDVTDFMTELRSCEQLNASVQNLIPTDAIADSDHPFWDRRRILRNTLQCYDFAVRSMLFSLYGYGETEEDRLDIFNAIRALYVWHHPNFRFTQKYEDEAFFYLDLEQDCFGGPEVIGIVKRIAQEYQGIVPKSKRKKEAKAEVYKLFHVVDRKLPRWIQGPMWPMGVNSPMQFVSQKRQGSVTMYTFIDADTDAIKVIEQCY